MEKAMYLGRLFGAKLRWGQEASRPRPQVAVPRHGRSPQTDTTINPWGCGYIMNNLLTSGSALKQG